MLIHVVTRGETVYSIARAYGVDPDRLISDNGIPPDGALAVGQALLLLFPRLLHAVTEGDSLTSIAVRYRTSVRALLRNNYFLMGRDAISPGDVLVVEYEGEKLGSIVTNGYAYPTISRNELSAVLPYMSCLTPFTYGIDQAGNLLPLQDETLLEAAQLQGVFPLLHLSSITEDGSFSNARSTMILTDPLAQSSLIDQVIATARAKGYRGIDVDFEFVPPEEREAYAAFIHALRSRAAPLSLPVLVALAPKTSAEQRGLLYEAHDYTLLGAAADFVLLMTYEWGYTYGPPMAVAPLPSVRAVLDYAVTEIPREKIFLGIPNYGYDWPLPFVQGTTRARSISNQEAIELALRYGVAIQYDETAHAPFFHYTDGSGTVHEVWFEDARSLADKFSLVAEYGFQGVGIWNLMRPFSQTWLVLDSLYSIQ